MSILLFLLLSFTLNVKCAKWNDCDTCVLSVSSFVNYPQMGKKMRKRDKLKQVCNFVNTHVGDSKPLKICDTVLREVIANKAVFRKMQDYNSKGLNMKWFCARELSKSYCTSKNPTIIHL